MAKTLAWGEGLSHNPADGGNYPSKNNVVAVGRQQLRDGVRFVLRLRRLVRTRIWRTE